MTTRNHHRNALLQAIQREWDLLLRAVDKLSPAQITAPDAGGWSPKDNLAHLTEWMKIMLGYHLDGKPSHEVMGLPPEQVENWDFNVMNAILFQRNKDRSAEDVLTELKSVYAQVITRLRAMPFEDLLKPHFADDAEKRPVLLWVLGNTTEHFKEHRTTIEKLLK